MEASEAVTWFDHARPIARWILAASMVWIGVMHFVHPKTFVDIMPPYLPWHLELVWISGAIEIALGVLLIPEFTRGYAAIGLIALFVAVYPANIHMAMNDVPFKGRPVPRWAHAIRLPLQFVFMAWAWWVR